MRGIIIFIGFLLFVFVRPVAATTYYISANGDDAGAGTSTATAWRTIGRVNAGHYRPGDRLFFEGGQIFTGSVSLRADSQGTAEDPLVLGSYGTARATISSGKACGLYAYNAGGIEVRRLNFVGAGRLSNASSGVVFYLDSAATHLRHVVLDSLEVSGYRSSGISIGSWKGSSGYDDVRVAHCRFHDNGEAGLSSYAEDLAAHHNWYVANCVAYNNSGRADVTTTHTGNGIVLGGLDGALVEYCEAYNNGWLNANPDGGPVGIWGWCCNNLVIQKCESHHNRSGTPRDGGGFDLDGGCTNSILQYNYSHDNDGPGYLLAQYAGAPPLTDVTIRYNISENDARRYDLASILLWSSGDNGGIQRAAIYNNTVFLSPPPSGSRPRAVYVSSAGMSQVTLRNNMLQTTGGLPVVESVTPAGVLFQGNCYWSTEGGLLMQWNGATFNSLAAWRAATGQELIGTRATGWALDPLLVAAGSGGNLPGGAAALPQEAPLGYRLRAGSPLVGTALDLRAEFGVAPGAHDCYGEQTPLPGTPGNVGASESRPATALAVAKAGVPAASWCQLYPNPARDFLHLSLVLPAGVARAEVRLYDSQGRLCRSVSVAAGSLTVPVTGLPAGLYLLEAIGGPERKVQHVLIQAGA